MPSYIIYYINLVDNVCLESGINALQRSINELALAAKGCHGAAISKILELEIAIDEGNRDTIFLWSLP